MYVPVTHRRPVFRSHHFIRGIKILPVQYRIGTVLLAPQIPYESKRIVRLVLVRRRLGCRTDDYHRKYGETYDNHRKTEEQGIRQHRLLLHSMEKPPETCSQQGYHEKGGSGVERESQNIHEKQVGICREFRQIRYDTEQDDGEYDGGKQEYLHILPERIMPVLTLLVVEHEDKSRNRKQVQQVYAYGQAHQKRYEHYPPVRIRRVGLFVPLRHRPEYHRREKRRHRIDLSFDRRKPESVGEAVSQRTDYSRAVNGNGAGN